MNGKEVRMQLRESWGVAGEARIEHISDPSVVRFTIAKSSSGSFQGDLPLREFIELLSLMSEIGRPVRGHVAIEEAVERKKEENEASRKPGSWADRSFEQISILAESVQKLTLALTPALQRRESARRGRKP